MALALRQCPTVLRDPAAATDANAVCGECFYFSKRFCASTAVVSDTWVDYNVSPKAHHQMKRLAVHALPRGAPKVKGKTGTKMGGRGMPADWSKDRLFQAVDMNEKVDANDDPPPQI